MRNWLIVAILSIASANAFACSRVENDVAQNLAHEAVSSLNKEGGASDVDFDILPLTCKSWPQRPEFSIVTRPYVYRGLSSNGGVESYLGMIVAVVNKNTGAVTNKVNEDKAMVIDAIEPAEIWIDTANYKLNDSDLAFGIRISRHNLSSIVQIHEEISFIYMPEGGSLKSIVNGLLTKSYNGEGNGRCQFSGSDVKTVLTVGESNSNGYFDLVASTKTTPISYTGSESSCSKTTGSPTTARYVLKYDGNAYPIPKPLKASLN